MYLRNLGWVAYFVSGSYRVRIWPDIRFDWWFS